MKNFIAMSAYNGAKNFQDELDSLFAQTRLPEEMVECDNDSSDETIGKVPVGCQ